METGKFAERCFAGFLVGIRQHPWSHLAQKLFQLKPFQYFAYIASPTPTWSNNSFTVVRLSDKNQMVKKLRIVRICSVFGLPPRGKSRILAYPLSPDNLLLHTSLHLLPHGVTILLLLCVYQSKIRWLKRCALSGVYSVFGLPPRGKSRKLACPLSPHNLLAHRVTVLRLQHNFHTSSSISCECLPLARSHNTGTYDEHQVQ